MSECFECDKTLSENERIATNHSMTYFKCDKCQTYTVVLKALGRKIIGSITEEEIVSEILKEERKLKRLYQAMKTRKPKGAKKS